MSSVASGPTVAENEARSEDESVELEDGVGKSGRIAPMDWRCGEVGGWVMVVAVWIWLRLTLSAVVS